MTSTVPRTPRVGPDGGPRIGTGLVAGVSWLVTGDEAWQRRLAQIESRIRVCYLGDYV